MPDDVIDNKWTLVQVMSWHWIEAIPDPLMAKITDIVWCYQATMNWLISHTTFYII